MTRKQEQRTYGGLTKKQHDRMIATAAKADKAYRDFLASGGTDEEWWASERGEVPTIVKPTTPKAEAGITQTTATKAIPEVTIRTEVTNAYKGQINGDVIATTKEGKTVGILQYEQFEDEVTIAWVVTSPEFRRGGIATQLYDALRKEWPNKAINWGMTTPEGTALRESIEAGIEPVSKPVTPKAEAGITEVAKPTVTKEPWQMTKAEVEEMDRKYSLEELRELCRERGVSASGDKKTLVRRLF